MSSSSPSSSAGNSREMSQVMSHRVAEGSVSTAQKEALANFRESYARRTARSRELAQEHRAHDANPHGIRGFRKLWKDLVYDLAIEKSFGSRLLDVDGNEYIDLCNGYGSSLLGHSPKFLTDALAEQVDQGIEVGPQNLAAMEAARAFCEATGTERASFVCSGSEAVQAAIRLARTVTGRDKIVIFEGSYHGSYDEVLVEKMDDAGRAYPAAPGIPVGSVDDVVVVEYGTDAAIDFIREHATTIAAILVEPIQARRPDFVPQVFLEELREITREAGVVLAFDESVTGFRFGLEGVRKRLGIEPDLAIYGKALAGGIPIGVVAGTAELMDTFDGGPWAYGDDSFPEKSVTFFAGTFVRHPLAVVALREMIGHLAAAPASLWKDLDEKADRFVSSIEALFRDGEFPFEIAHCGSLIRLRETDSDSLAGLLYFYLRERGVYLLENSALYLTTAHTDAEVDYLVAAFSDALVEMQSAGFLPQTNRLAKGELEPLARTLVVEGRKSHRETIGEWNKTATDYPRDASIPELFAATVADRGEAEALRFGSDGMSYAALEKLSLRVANTLADHGITAGARVGLFLQRAPETIAANLAVLRLGAVCVPLDPEYPLDRIQFIVSDSEVDLVLAPEFLVPRVSSLVRVYSIEKAVKGRAARIGEGAIDSLAAAYVLYTSGSTGEPKGVLIPHQAVVRLVRDTNYCDFGPDEVFLHASSPCFDVSLLEFFAPLLNGGILSLPSTEMLTIDEIAKCIEDHCVSTLWFTAGLFQVIIDERVECLAGVRQLISGGDVMSVSHAEKVMTAFPDLKLINGYGPTEATTFVTAHPVTEKDIAGGVIPIGRPISNSTIWILDDDREPVAPGVAGELWTGGAGLALGYLNRPEVTAERFIDDPFSDEAGARLYRTGDLCRYRPDGVIEFVGRRDRQVKIRGFRVEPGEIEMRLTEHPAVAKAKISLLGDDVDQKRLIANVSLVEGGTVREEDLVAHLHSRIPEYMIPAQFEIREELPLNANGKVDLQALDAPEVEPPLIVASEGADTETRLAAIWGELLSGKEIGIDDDFFDLGGHSLLGMRMFSRIQKHFGVTLALGTLFRAPTVRQLAVIIDEKSDDEADLSSRASTGRESRAVLSSEGIAETTVAIQASGDLAPLFAVHGGDGGVMFYRNVARRLGEARPFYALEAPALTSSGPVRDEPVEMTAERYVAEIQKIQPDGPYLLCGYSFGGLVAYEMAVQLTGAGYEVAFLGLIDTENPLALTKRHSLAERIKVNWNERNREGAGAVEKSLSLASRILVGLGYRLRGEVEGLITRKLPPAKSANWVRLAQIRNSHEQAMMAYEPSSWEGNLTLFKASIGNDKFDYGETYGWDLVVSGEIDLVSLPGNHISLFHEANVPGVADGMKTALDTVTV